MSYIRWAEEDSNVYVIGRDIPGKPYQCVGCTLSLLPHYGRDLPAGLTEAGYFSSKEAILRHLMLHRLCGDIVPDKAFRCIESDKQ